MAIHNEEKAMYMNEGRKRGQQEVMAGIQQAQAGRMRDEENMAMAEMGRRRGQEEGYGMAQQEATAGIGMNGGMGQGRMTQDGQNYGTMANDQAGQQIQEIAGALVAGQIAPEELMQAVQQGQLPEIVAANAMQLAQQESERAQMAGQMPQQQAQPQLPPEQTAGIAV